MPIFNEKNIARQAVSSTTEIVYTVPADTVTVVKDIHICNNGSTDCHITMWLVPNGASATDDNIIFYEWNVPGNDFVHWAGYQILDVAGDTIRAKSQTNNQITVTISGAELT